ncbi:MAG: aldo/keto reductase [Deltaproteobacteria bacterium]|nr:aldo/keto reductase [Deltaproteobacteria bacterium]
MTSKGDSQGLGRRDFMKISAGLAICGQTLLVAPEAGARKQAGSSNLIRRNERPSMTYRKLGRTCFHSSRLVFGCGAALAGGKAVRLLDRAFEAGINHFDVGSEMVYRGAERSLAPFLKAHRDEVWVASKAPVYIRIGPGASLTTKKAQAAARKWVKLLNRSLKNLEIAFLDTYYLMGVNSPALVKCEEMYEAFQKAKAAGKVRHFGLSTHENAGEVLKAAIEIGWYDVAMIGITPAGWYDWLEKARQAGIGLIGMKTVRYLASAWVGGQGDPFAFDHIYDKKIMAYPLNPFQRAYAYTLEHGLDVVNADMQNFKHLEEDIVVASKSHTYFS